MYLAKWRYAMFILAVLSAVLTPSLDVISMLWLFVPMFGLYMVGVLLCYMIPRAEPAARAGGGGGGRGVSRAGRAKPEKR